MMDKLNRWIDAHPWPSFAAFTLAMMVLSASMVLFFDYLEGV